MLQYANRSRPMNIAVVGAGWAGLAAAQRLKQYGHAVTVFEAAQTLGGRARRVHSRALNTHIANGQHILLGASTETLALLRPLGMDPAVLFHRERHTHIDRASRWDRVSQDME